MKTTSKEDRQSKQNVNNKQSEIRDNLDSRKNEEMNDARSGHNKKETKEGKSKLKR